jgi:hypothetical protein
MTETNFTIDEFEKIIFEMPPATFENFVGDILLSLDNITSISSNVVLQGRQFDIIAVEKNIFNLDQPVNIIVEIKRYKNSITGSILSHFYSDLYSFNNKNNFKFLFVTTSNLTQQAKQLANQFNISVWNLHDIYEKLNSKIVSKYFGKNSSSVKFEKIKNSKKEDYLIESLKEINPGKVDWSKFQHKIFEILEYLFCPPLEIPHYELADFDSRNRRDIIFENDSNVGFWRTIREFYQGFYIVVDAKNYSKPLTKRPIIDISHYLKSYGCGLFGMIICREGSGGASEHAIKEQWIGSKKMIIVLSDEDLIEMLNIKKEGGAPDQIIRKKIADFRMKL